VQTFLPYPDFELSARALDPKRLGKQRVEALQVVRALTWPGYGWANHPAVLMWRGFEEALGRYGLTCCEVWLERGFGDTCAASIVADLEAAGLDRIRSETQLRRSGVMPPWLGDDAFHRSHRSALIRKDPGHYGQLFPDTPGDLPYVWPVRSPAVIEAEERRAARAALREERTLERARQEADRRRALRSRAAKKAWRTRRRNARTSAPSRDDEGEPA
jgi:hypothetical protein